MGGEHGKQEPRFSMIATAYNIHTADLVARIVATLGKASDASRFRAMAQRFRRAFCDRFVTADGRIVGDSQTAYALALSFDLLPQELRKAALDRLEHDIVHGRSGRWPYPERKGHISSGFVGVNQVMPGLSAGGRLALAYRLLLNEECPSWLFPVNHGATTIWERWDGYHPERGFHDPGVSIVNS